MNTKKSIAIPTTASSQSDLHPSRPVQRATVSGRSAWRHNGSDGNPTTAPTGITLPERRVYAPQRIDVARTALDLQKMKNLARNTLGSDFRINENLTANVPTAILPQSLRKQGGY